jgi:hypothetical protein
MLDLDELRLDDNGNYTCHVFNKFGYINKTFELVVYGKLKQNNLNQHSFLRNPVYLICAFFDFVEDDSQIFEGLDPVNTTIVAGMDAVFNCRVKSNTAPSIKVN